MNARLRKHVLEMLVNDCVAKGDTETARMMLGIEEAKRLGRSQMRKIKKDGLEAIKKGDQKA